MARAFSGRISALMPVDEIWFTAGANDGGVGYNTVANVLAALTAARAAAPSAPIIVFGAFNQTNNAPLSMLASETTIASAFAQWADANSYFVPMLTATYPPQTGRLGRVAQCSILGTALTVGTPTVSVSRFALSISNSAAYVSCPCRT